MKTILIILIFLFAIAFESQSQDLAQKIDSLLVAYMKVYRFNGNAFVYKKGKLIFENSYGYQDIKNKIPNTSNTIFQVGSLTKQFTATVILKLAEENKLALSDKLVKYFPDYPKGNIITIEHLLTHTSGIYEYFKNPAYYSSRKIALLTKEQRLSFFINEPSEFEPGTAFSYCNSGYELLGLIIEKVTKMHYEQVVRELILEPLKMVNTGFDFNGLNSDLKAKPYILYSKENFQESVPWDSTTTFSAGSLYSNANDLLLWHNGLQRSSIIKTSSLEKAFTPFLNGYGYAWWIDSLYNRKVVSHGGNVEGFTCHFLRVPEDDMCIILLNNTYNHEIEKIANSIFAILYNKPYKFLGEIKLTNAELDKYEGEYEVNANYHIKVKRVADHLSVQINKETQFNIYPENIKSFFSREEDLRIKFKSDSTDNLTSIRIFKGLNTKSGLKLKK